MRVSLGRNNHRYVHRLVAEAFLPNPDGLPQVDHIDGDRKNNRLENLRWVTARQNSAAGGERHQWEAQRIASAKRRIHEAKKQEYQTLVAQGYSLRQIAKLFGTSHSTIRRALSY
jgi:DNA-directed RNA polymerase specialized sigma24 family protein